MPRFVLAALAAALLGGASQAQPYPIHFNGNLVNLSPGQCARKAVEAMAKEKLLYASVTEDGHAVGWTEKTTVVVMVMPQAHGDQAGALCFAVGRDNEEAGRLRLAISGHLTQGPPGPGAREVYCSKEASGKETNAPEVRWRVEKRPAISTAKYLVPVTSLLFEKRGFAVFSEPGKTVILGSGHDRAAAVFAGPSTSAVHVTTGTVVFSPDEGSSERLGEELFTTITKLLFE